MVSDGSTTTDSSSDETELSSDRPHGLVLQLESDDAGSGVDSSVGFSTPPGSSPNIMARIDRRASGFRSVSGSDPCIPAASGSGAPDSSGAKLAVSCASSAVAGLSDSVAASISAGCSSSDGPKCRGSDSSSMAGLSLGGAVVSAAIVGSCQGPVNAGAGGETGGVVTGGVTGPVLAGAGGVQPVAGAGSTLC